MVTEFSVKISFLDPSYGELLWSSALYASSGHPHVTCQVFTGALLAFTLSHSLNVTCTSNFMCVFFHDYPGRTFRV